MKILYTIANTYGLGADRWIYDGYRHAFGAERQEFYKVTQFDGFEKRTLEIKPDLLLLDFCFLIVYANMYGRGEVSPNFFRDLKNRGTTIFCLVPTGTDKEELTERVSLFRKYLPFFDLCYSYQLPEVTNRFQGLFGKEIYCILPAADTHYFFPDRPDKRYESDIAFVGSFYTAKKDAFRKLLYPLYKKYKVLVYGPGWMITDRILRLGSGLSRRLGWEKTTCWINDRRITISPDEERKLYVSAKICVNIHEYYPDGTIRGYINDREFKVPACGGFQLSDYIPGMEHYFKLGKEIVVVRNTEEWFSQIDYYLHHPDERKAIQQRGTARVLGEHTYRHRARQIMDLYNEKIR